MCGVSLIKLKGKTGAPNMVYDILRMLSDRGKDAWGYALLGKENELLEFNNFIGNIKRKSNRGYLKSKFNLISDGGAIILHSRLATSGFSGISAHNHPIKYNHILLVHNGLITEEIGLNQTDSIFLAKTISEKKNLNDLASTLNSFSGEISTIWHDAEQNKSYFYSNVGGMYLYEDGELQILCSEPLASRGKPAYAKFKRVNSKEIKEI